LLALGTLLSPELAGEHVQTGEASPALLTILRFASARAVGLGDRPGEVSIVRVRLLVAPDVDRQQVAASRGPVVVDIDLEFCTSRGEAVLLDGADFEHRVAVSVQGFAAFHPSALRVLEFEDLSPKHESEPEASTIQPNARDIPTTSLPGQERWVPDSPLIPGDALVWLSASLLVATVGLSLSLWQLHRRRRLKQERIRLEFEAAVPGLEEMSAEAAAANISPVAMVLYPFDPLTEDAGVFAAAAGLEPTECLKVAVGDLVDGIAWGEGWLYGRLVSAGLFGYLPAECVQWVPNTPSHPGEADGAPPRASVAVPAAVATGPGLPESATQPA